MRDLSLFLIKNSLGAKMKKGLRNFCNDDGSTSTLNQHHKTSSGDHHHSTADHTSSDPAVPVVHSPTNYYVQQNHNTNSIASSNYTKNPDHHQNSPPPTLEEMILRLDLEEEIAARSKYSKLKDYNKYKYYNGRMSCVNNSDILRSARNALNQYPRFSLDGKDAMYRSSFRNSLDDHLHNNINIADKPAASAAKAAAGVRKSVCFSDDDYAGHLRSGKVVYDDETGHHDTSSTYAINLRCRLPATVAGESVVWCKPGVVAKLMGLEAIPVPVSASSSKLDICKDHLPNLGSMDVMNMKRRNLMIRRNARERQEIERRLVDYNFMDMNANGRQCAHRSIHKHAAAGKRTTAASSSCTTSKTSTTAAGYTNNNYCIMKPGVLPTAS